jgi:hypothetical protein
MHSSLHFPSISSYALAIPPAPPSPPTPKKPINLRRISKAALRTLPVASQAVN